MSMELLGWLADYRYAPLYQDLMRHHVEHVDLLIVAAGETSGLYSRRMTKEGAIVIDVKY